jgi:hypothetical protein
MEMVAEYILEKTSSILEKAADINPEVRNLPDYPLCKDED